MADIQNLIQKTAQGDAEARRTLEQQIRTLEESQRRSELMVQQNPMAILLLDGTFKVTDTNDAFVKMAGIERAQVLAMSARDFKILDQKGEGLKDTVKQKKHTFGQVTVELPSGVHMLEQHGIPVLNAAGEIAHILTVFNDVTEQRKKEQKMLQLKKRIETIVHDNPMAFLVLDREFKVLDLNPAYEALMEQTRDRLMKMEAAQYKIRMISGEKTDLVFTQEKKIRSELEITFKDGRKKIIEQYGVPIRNEKGEVVTAFFVFNELTAQRQKEAEVQRLMEESRKKADALAASARELETALEKVAQGDLTAMVEIREGDSLGKLKEYANTAVDSLRAVIQEVNKVILQVESGSRDATRGTEEIAKGAEQVAVAAQGAANGARDQMKIIEEVNREVSDLSASIEEIASTSHSVAEEAKKVADQGTEAAGMSKEVTAKVAHVEQISKTAAEEISKLNNQMREIGNVVKLITDIANQTNLLALNAAIEAARAGEHGRGFAVVAGEVRNLAGESKHATAQIESVISSLTASSAKTADSINNAFREMQAAIGAIDRTIRLLDQIVVGAQGAARNVAEITRATEDQAGGTNKVVQRVDNIATLIKTGLQTTEDLAAISEETSASTEEVASATQELSRMASNLKEMISRFRLN